MVLERVMEDTADFAKVEQQPSSEGRTMSMMLTPIKK
jgi:translation initiation factor IF-3